MSSAPPVQIPALDAPPAKGGCLRAGLIGCGVVALLLVLGFVGVVLYAKKNPGFFLDVAMGQIEKNYGPDVTEEDKKDLRAAVADFKEAIRNGSVKRDRGGAWQKSFSMRGNQSGKLTHDDVRELIRTFREAAGREPAGAPAAAPVPTPA
jgi:hypothetical protein